MRQTRRQWVKLAAAERIRVWVDGELVNEYAPSRTRRGAIGMQIHGQRPHDHVVKFRHIRLRHLQ